MTSTGASDSAILDILISRGALAPATKRTIQLFASKWSCSHFSALIESSVISEGELADALALMVQIPRLHGISSQHISPEVLGLLSYSTAREFEAIPVANFEDTGKVEVAVANPADENRVNALRKMFSGEIVLAVGERSDIVSAIDEMYPLKNRWPSVWDCVKSK